MKISIVGMGNVGCATAFALVLRGIPHELVLVGRTKEKAFGDAYDLQHAAAMVRPIRIISGNIDETAGSDLILFCASDAPSKLGDRLANAEANGKLARRIIPALAAASPSAILIMMTNPVDVLTYVALKASGFPPSRVLGTGTLIDTFRFRALLSEEIGVNAVDIRAYILGEHGDSQFPALSVASAGGVHIEPEDATVRRFVEEAKQSGHRVAGTKGYTNFGIATGAAMICEAVANDSRTTIPVSTLIEGYKGIRDACLSLPCVIGRNGIARVLAIDLNDDEAAKFRRSAAIVRAVIEQLEMLEVSGAGSEQLLHSASSQSEQLRPDAPPEGCRAS